MSAVAEVLMMPGIRQVPVRRLPLERRRELLAFLAENLLDLPAELVELGRDSWVHDSLYGPAREEAWGRYLERQALADAVDAGIADWDWACGSCGHPLGRACFCSCCPSASEQAHRDAEQALDVLAGGAR